MLREFKLHHEAGRQRALLRHSVLDTDEEEPVERIVRLVEQTLSLPISSVTLIDEPRQWFKAKRGVEVCEGVAELGAGQDLDGLIAGADAALYRAKLAGRNQVVLAAPSD